MSSEFQRRLTYRFRETVGPWIDGFARTLGQPMTRIRASEYAETAHCRIDDLEACLHDAGFRWDPLSLYHYTPLGTRGNGSWVYREWPLADRQLHAVLFSQSADRVDVYAHDEYNWLRHPIKHAREVDIRHREGAEEMRAHLDDADVDTYHEPYVVRKLFHLYEKVTDPDSLPVRLPR
ncbi:MAG: hypothetical protein ABEJ31_12660 [Haloarculaceae archaeon]